MLPTVFRLAGILCPNDSPTWGKLLSSDRPEWVEIYASARGYLPLQTPLLKPVRAIKGSFVCRFGRYVFIDGNMVARAKYLDTNHRMLPVWKGCRTLKSDEIFVLGQHRDSFDSRYFGPVNRTQFWGLLFVLLISSSEVL